MTWKSVDLHAIAAYLKKQVDEEGQALYEVCAHALGYYITDIDLKNTLDALKVREEQIYAIEDPIQKQKALIEFTRSTKELKVLVQTKMPTIPQEQREEALHIMEDIVVRMAETILGINLKSMAQGQP